MVVCTEVGLMRLRCLLFLFFSHLANAAVPAGYYNATAGLTGTALRSTLHNIIRGHKPVSYTNTRFSLMVTDQDPADSSRVILIYTGESKDGVNDWTANNPTDGWNREHLWPNSLGIDSVLPLYSDLFNLRPCDENVNSSRDNLYYDESTVGSTGYHNPAFVEAPLCTRDSDSWEPPESMKGDIARSLFYMDVRYEGDSGENNLQLTDNTALISSTASYMGRLSTLLIWHILDPVSDAERLRNERVQAQQGNRNPFIDNPQWVEGVYGEVFRLVSTQSGSNWLLSWPSLLPADMGVIETSSDLINWVPLGATVVDQGGWHTSNVFISGRRYYRLKLGGV